MYLSRYAEARFLNTMRGTAFTAPSQLYAGLFLSSPGEDGKSGVEIAYSGYKRMPITFAQPKAESTGIGIRNAAQITFPQNQPTSPHAGTVRFIGIYTALTGGELYMYGALTEDLQVFPGDSPVLLQNEALFFSSGDLSNTFKTKLLNAIRGTNISGFTPYVALFNGDPESGGKELAGSNYKRVALTFSAAVVDGGRTVIRNAAQVDFNRASSNWGSWTYTVIFDALTGGQAVWKQARAMTMPVTQRTMVRINQAAIVVGIN